MPPKISKKAAVSKRAAAKAKRQSSMKPASDIHAMCETESTSSAEYPTVFPNPTKKTNKVLTWTKSATQKRGMPLPLKFTGPPCPPSRHHPRHWMEDFRDYYALLRLDRHASHMKLSRAWERYATKEFDPLIKHKDANKELNDFVLWHDVYQWLLVDEYTRAFYNSRLEQFERLCAVGLFGRGTYHEAFFPYESDGEEYDWEDNRLSGSHSES